LISLSVELLASPRMHKTEMRRASWQDLPGAPAPGSHILQIYDSAQEPSMLY